MYERIAYLTEDCNVDDRGPVATGLFSCFVDRAADEPPRGEVADDVADSLSGWTGYVSTPAAVLRVNAGGDEGAIQAAVRAAADAAAAAGWEPAPAFSANHAFATDSDAARRSAHADATGIPS